MFVDVVKVMLISYRRDNKETTKHL